MRDVIYAVLACMSLVACGPAPNNQQGPSGRPLEKTTEHLVIDNAVIDKGDPSTVIDPVWWTADIYDDERRYNESLSSFSLEQRHVFAIAWHMAEVNNGGHEQFYSNSTGIVWQDALAGYKAVGLQEAALILEQSAARMGGKPGLERETREEQLDSLNPDFDDLDDRFYKLQKAVDFERAMMKYILNHRSAFYFEGDVEKTKVPDRQ
jgi:hypothetical protein